jgi:hypothetical protein
MKFSRFYWIFVFWWPVIVRCGSSTENKPFVTACPFWRETWCVKNNTKPQPQPAVRYPTPKAASPALNRLLSNRIEPI